MAYKPHPTDNFNGTIQQPAWYTYILDDNEGGKIPISFLAYRWTNSKPPLSHGLGGVVAVDADINHLDQRQIVILDRSLVLPGALLIGVAGKQVRINEECVLGVGAVLGSGANDRPCILLAGTTMGAETSLPAGTFGDPVPTQISRNCSRADLIKVLDRCRYTDILPPLPDGQHYHEGPGYGNINPVAHPRDSHPFLGRSTTAAVDASGLNEVAGDQPQRRRDGVE